MSNGVNYRNILTALSIPLTLLIFGLIYRALWVLFGWPQGDEFIKVITGFFNTYGLWVVLVSAILESALIIGNYFPGGVIIFLSVIAAGRDIPKIIFIVSVVCIGFMIGYTIDYFLGKYGWYKLLIKFGMKNQLESAKVKLDKHSFKAILFSYWEVNLASVTATAAGVLQMNFVKFSLESALGLVLWNIFWGTLVASLGKKSLELVTNLKYAIPVAVVWIVVIVINEYRKKHQPIGPR